RKALAGMGMPADLIDRFLAHRSYSPRHQYLIVTSLEAMERVADRRRLLDAALTVQTEGGAHLFQRLAEMTAAYHRTVRPLARISTDWGFPVGVLPGGQVVVLAPFDHVLWSELTSQFVARLPATAGRGQSARRSGDGAAAGAEVWVTGDVSARSRSELERRGYAIHPRSGERLPLAD
ncbi:MAG: hypothetical protein IT561_12715, partial [Alphaproteobacteria bacterium]|nr:hypothetical protein [Alphaproteobacteria bacterium]